MLISLSAAQEKTYDVPGAFSFQYGDGWNKGPRKGGASGELDWLVAASNPSASFHAVLAHADFSYDDWLHRTIKQATPDRALAAKADFVTSSGLKGEKLTWNIKAQNGQQYTSFNYLFPGKNNSQLQLSGLVDAADASKFEPAFDTFAKSLTLTPGK
jgi:hypothetical protein